MRSLLVDYDVTIAIVVTTLVSYTWTVASSQVERITLPADISPTCYHESPSGAGPATIACLATHEHKNWCNLPSRAFPTAEIPSQGAQRGE